MTGPISFSGLSSGLNSTAIINAEMAIFNQPLNNLKAEQTSINTKISAYQAINSQLAALQSAAGALATPSAYGQAYSVASTNSLIASASVTSSASAGSLTLSVDQLATNSTQISGGTVASTSQIVASGSLLIGVGGAALGVQSFSGATGLAAGSHTLTVTQSSEGATLTGSAALATTTISSANNQLSLLVNGSVQTLTIANGTYTPSQLTAAISSASNGTVSATLNAQGQLQLATTQQGSSATLQITGGSALATLGVSAGGLATGQDGIISLDGTSTTVSQINGTGTTAVSLASGTGGTVTANLSGGLAIGTISAKNISVSTGSLNDVVSAVNSAGLGVTASALQVAANKYALEITANATGTAAAATVDATAFAGSDLGTLSTTVAAQNAKVSIGGPGGYQITSQSNTITGLLQGVSVQVSQVSASPVTISVAADGAKISDKVQSLVDAANNVLSTIHSVTGYNSATNTAGALNGDISLASLAQSIVASVGSAIGHSAAGNDGTPGESAGIAVTSTGSLTFNQAAFVKAYNANPTAVQSIFVEGGTFAGDTGAGHTVGNTFPPTSVFAGLAQVAGADNNAIPGTYIVAVSQSATRASVRGSATFAGPTSTIPSAESYTITSGSTSATLSVAAGESLKDVVSGLNAQLAASGIGATANLVTNGGSSQVQIVSTSYGAAATFSVATGGADQLGIASASPYTGTDVAGTINGVAATGVGQYLTGTGSSNPANGLVVQVTASGITTPTTIGAISYSPGFAQNLSRLAQLSSTGKGEVPLAIAGLQSTLSQVDQNIVLQQRLSDTQKASLQQEYATLEQTLAKLNSQTQFLNALGGIGSSSSSSGSSSSRLSTSGG